MDNATVVTHPHTHETAVAAEHEHVALPQHRHHFETQEQQREAGTFGMWLFLLTEIMFFGGMFFAYLLYRNWYYDARWGGLNGWQPANGEQVGIFDQKRVESAKKIVALDDVIVGTEIGQHLSFDKIPPIEIEASARSCRRRVYRAESAAVNGWVRTTAIATFAPASGPLRPEISEN